MTNQPKATQSLTKSARTLRITVRGSFEVLTHDQQAELRSRADQHDLLRAHFTEEGHLAYDIDAR
ncbi:MAG: hypothetical protein JWP11_1449, partial [Frankiales bacterium]|nr:hypothetical protein [Frankiales bacterium]